MSTYAKRLCALIAGLFVLDQAIKLVIYANFFHIQRDIFGSFLRFYPVINDQLSFLGSLFGGAFANLAFTLFVNLGALLALCTGYLYYSTVKRRQAPLVIMLFALGIAGCLCSLVDKLFWGGSLDFLDLNGLFIFDLKDCYLSATQGLALYFGLFHYRRIDLSKYFLFLKKRFSPSGENR